MPNDGTSALPAVPAGPTTCAAVYELRAVIRTKQWTGESENERTREKEREGYMTGAGAMTHCRRRRRRQRGIG